MGMDEGTLQVIADLPCVGCAYNLRMQPAATRCPECGMPIERSLRETILLWGPKYLKRLGRCAAWIAVTAMAMPVLYFLGMIGELVFFRTRTLAQNDFRVIEVVQLAIQSLILAVAAVHAAAVWIFSAKAPARRPIVPNIMMRAGVAMFIGVFALLMLRAAVNFVDTFMSVPLGPYAFWVERFFRYLEYALPLLLFGLAIYPIAGALRIAEIYARAGLSSRILLPKWSLLLFGAAWGIIAMVISLAFLMDIFHILFLRFLEITLAVTALGAAGVALLSLIGALVGLFKFRNRMRELAAIAPVPGSPLTAVVVTGEAS